MPRDELLLNQDTAPSTPPSKSVQGKTHDDKDDPYYCCAAHRLCLSMGDQTSQLLMCINCNQPFHLICAEYLMEQKPVDEDHTLYISVRDFTKEGRVCCKKISASEKDNIVFCILCSAKIKLLRYRLRPWSLQSWRTSINLPIQARQHQRRKWGRQRLPPGSSVSCAAWLHFRHSYSYSLVLRRQNQGSVCPVDWRFRHIPFTLRCQRRQGQCRVCVIALVLRWRNFF